MKRSQLAASALLIALIFLGLAWELVLAPLRPGGSWLVVKVLPLLAPLFGILHGRRRAYQWSSLLVWLYFGEGVARAATDGGLSAQLATAEAVLSLAFFAAVVAYLRSPPAGVSARG